MSHHPYPSLHPSVPAHTLTVPRGGPLPSTYAALARRRVVRRRIAAARRLDDH